VFENTGKEFMMKYSIKGSFGSTLKNCVCPNKAPLCCLRKTKFTIIDKNTGKEDET